MTPAKGYYSLIQYCPDLGRLEAANVGILLFCPERLFLEAKMSSNNRRITQFFGREGHDWNRINSFKKGLEERLFKESSDIRTFEDLQRFIALQANTLQITPPRPMKVFDPRKDLDKLAVEFLGQIAKPAHSVSLRRHIQKRLFKAGLQSKLRTEIVLEVPILKKQVEIPFGYQNGRFNLLTDVGFSARDRDRSVSTACKYAVEGQSLFENEHPDLGKLRLCVIGKFRAHDKETPLLVKGVLEKHCVHLYRADDLATLIDEIRRTGKDLQAPTDGTTIA
jgi:hypothetical protein